MISTGYILRCLICGEPVTKRETPMMAKNTKQQKAGVIHLRRKTAQWGMVNKRTKW